MDALIQLLEGWLDELGKLQENLSNFAEQEIPLLELITTALVALLVIWLIQRVLLILSRRNPQQRLRWLGYIPAARLLIVMVAIVFALLRLPNTAAVLAAAAVGIGFAFKDLLSSILAGIVAITEGTYQPGDWVLVDGDYGEVKQVGLRSFKMVTPDDSTITVPHSTLWDNNVSNANVGLANHMVVATFYLAPQHDAAAVRQKLWDVGVTSPFINLQHPPLVIVREKPWGTEYRLKVYPKDGRDEFLFISDLTVLGKAALTEMGVQFATTPAAVGPF